MRSRHSPFLIAFLALYSLAMGLGVLWFGSSGDEPMLALVMMIVLVSGLAAALVDPYVGLVMLLTSIYLRPGDRYPELERFRLTMLLFAVTTGVWLAQYLITRRPPLARTRMNTPMLGLAGACMLSWVPISIRGGLNTIYQSVGKSMVLYLLVINLVRSAARLRTVLWLMVIFAAANSYSAIGEFQAGESRFEDRAAGVGVMADPNDLALTLVMALPLAFALFRIQPGFFRRLALVVAVVLMLWAMGVCRSRGGYLGAALVLFLEGYHLIRHPGRRRLYIVVAGLVGLVGLNLLFAARGAALTEVSEDDNAMTRRGAWTAGWYMLLDRPVTGVGLMMFADQLDHYAPSWMPIRYLNAHNSIVQASAELGLPGAISFLWIVLGTYLAAARLRQDCERQQASNATRDISGALQRSFAGWFVCAFFLSQAYHFWLYIIVGLVVAQQRLWQQELAAREGTDQAEGD